MNESTLTHLKIIIERAIRPVRASMSCKCKMREELLAHVNGVFEEEFSQLDDEHCPGANGSPVWESHRSDEPAASIGAGR
jgi:hypothetical protein